MEGWEFSVTRDLFCFDACSQSNRVEKRWTLSCDMHFKRNFSHTWHVSHYQEVFLWMILFISWHCIWCMFYHLTRTLPARFPLCGPVVRVSPPIRHPWVNAQVCREIKIPCRRFLNLVLDHTKLIYFFASVPASLKPTAWTFVIAF